MQRSKAHFPLRELDEALAEKLDRANERTQRSVVAAAAAAGMHLEVGSLRRSVAPRELRAGHSEMAGAMRDAMQPAHERGIELEAEPSAASAVAHGEPVERNFLVSS
eukprot:scaffold13900_cov93-Isochrysis_galbana.AAC.3